MLQFKIELIVYDLSSFQQYPLTLHYLFYKGSLSSSQVVSECRMLLDSRSTTDTPILTRNVQVNDLF